jgi:hypothetical protein
VVPDPEWPFDAARQKTGYLSDALMSFDMFNSLMRVEDRYASDERYRSTASRGSGGPQR